MPRTAFTSTSTPSITQQIFLLQTELPHIYRAIANTDTTFVQCTSTANTTYTPGNYVKFTGETANTLALKLTETATNAGITGFQIVNTTATYANNFIVTGNASLDVSGTTLVPRSAR